MEITIQNMRHGYIKVCNTVVDFGDPAEPRGISTREITGARIILDNPFVSLPIGIGRNLNTRFAAVEALQLIAGESHPDLMVKINPNVAQFMDNGEFHGAYGPRIARAMKLCQQRLVADPSSRQAVATIFSSNEDLEEKWKDVPCTVALHFMIRNRELDLHTYMRSNDVWWGLAYDVFQFTQLQITFANVLGVGVGKYYHNASSLHAYEKDIRDIKNLKYESHVPDRSINGISVPPTYHDDIGVVQQRAARILANKSLDRESLDETWYRNRIHRA